MQVDVGLPINGKGNLIGDEFSSSFQLDCVLFPFEIIIKHCEINDWDVATKYRYRIQKDFCLALY